MRLYSKVIADRSSHALHVVLADQIMLHGLLKTHSTPLLVLQGSNVKWEGTSLGLHF